MLDQNQIDWNAVDGDMQVASASTNASQTTKEASKFIKMKAGFHYLRIVPAGNPLQKKPYLHLVQHPVKTPKDDGTGFYDKFVLCWSSVLNDLVTLGDPNKGGSPQMQKERSIVSYLGQVKAIDNQQFELYRTHGCPLCKAYNHLQNMGVPNDDKKAFYPQEQYFFNVIHRSKQPDGMPSFGDDNVYIWRQAKRNGGQTVSVINTMRKQANINYLDINTGRDILIQATGEGLGRRYPVNQFLDFPSPLNLGERLTHNLLDILVASHNEYQKVVNLMKISYGKILQDHGYVIPGDTTVQAAYPVVNQAAYQAQQAITQAQQPTQYAPGMVTQLPSPVQQQVQVHPVTEPVTTPPSYDPSFQSGDQIIEKDGKLFNTRTGKFLF